MNDTQRKEFEKFARQGGWEVHRNGKPDYVQLITQSGWEGYQAALASESVMGLVEALEKLARLNEALTQRNEGN